MSDKDTDFVSCPCCSGEVPEDEIYHCDKCDRDMCGECLHYDHDCQP